MLNLDILMDDFEVYLKVLAEHNRDIGNEGCTFVT